MKTVMMFIILAVVWVLFIFNRKLKRTVNRTAQDLNPRRTAGVWGTGDCGCGTPRNRWKALAMNRPDNTVLLICPMCMTLWEEHMTLNGNKWKTVDTDYAKANYDYNEEYGRTKVDS